MAQISDHPASPFERTASTTASRTQYWLILSLILVFAGQFILRATSGDDPNERIKQAIAGGLLVIGAGVFGASMGVPRDWSMRLEFPSKPLRPAGLAWSMKWVLASFTASILCGILAVILFANTGENITVVLLWLASIILLCIASTGDLRVSEKSAHPQDRIYKLALLGIIVVALITRVYRLSTLPYNVDGDFASVGIQARALATGQQSQIFTYGWAEVPMLGYLPAWLTMKLFGTGLVGLNASGVIEGLLIVLGIYLLGRDLFHARVGLMAAALMTVSYAHLAGSRQSSYIDPVVFLLYGIYFLLLGLREGRTWAIAASAILTALCIQMYYSGRIIVFVVGLLLLFLLIFRPSWIKLRRETLLLWGLGIFITLGPMLVVFLRNPETLASHTRSVFILSPDIIKHMQGVYHVDNVTAMLWEQARHTVLLFHYYPDTGTQFGFRRPFLDPFTAPLFTLGLGYALFHWRAIGNSLMFTWTMLGLFFGCFLTVNPPFWARLLILLPPTILLAALALDLIYKKIYGGLHLIEKSNLPRLENKITWLAPALVIVLIGAVGVMNWNTYVELKDGFATPRTRISRYLAEQPPSIRAYLVSKDYTFQDREFEFLAPQHLIANLTAEQLNDHTTSLEPSKLIIVTPEQASVLSLLQQRFPEGTVEPQVGNPPGEIAFYVFRIP